MLFDLLRTLRILKNTDQKIYMTLVRQNILIAVLTALQGGCLYKLKIVLAEPVAEISFQQVISFSIIYIISAVGYVALLNFIFINMRVIYEKKMHACFSQHLNKSYSEIISTNNASLISFFTNDSHRLLANMFLPLALVVSNILLIIIYIAVLFFINTALTIAVISLAIFTYLVLVIFLKTKLHRNSAIMGSATEKISKSISMLMGGALEIKFYGLEEKQISYFHKAAQAFGATVAENHFLATLPKHLIDIMLFLMFAFIMFGNASSGSPQISISDMALFGLAGSRLLPASQTLYHAISSIAGNRDVLDKFEPLESQILERQFSPNSPNIPIGAILEVKKTSKIDSRYSKLKFDSLSFEIGKNYIIHGASGAGKSSIFLAIIGLLETDEVNIYVNNVRIKSNQLASNISIAVDSELFFNDSIINNINYFDSEFLDSRSYSELLELAEIDFLSVNQLLQNMQDGGRDFSKGERQRLSLARVLRRCNNNILLIDEGLTGLPVSQERNIYKKLFENFKCVITISHRVDNDDLFDCVYEV